MHQLLHLHAWLMVTILLPSGPPMTMEINKGLDFYCSKDTDLSHGFDPKDMIHIPTELFCNYKGKNNYQNINFVNDFDGKLYLVALENSKP